MLKTNTVKHVFTVQVTSETDRREITVCAENVLEALRLASEKLRGLDREGMQLYVKKEG